MANHLLRQLVKKHNLPVQIVSRGLSIGPEWPPDGASAHAIASLREQGVHSIADHRATLLTPDDLQNASLILVLTKEVRTLLIAANPGAAQRIRLLQSYAGEDEDDADVLDPPGQTLDEYRTSLQDMQAAMNHLCSTLTATPARRRKYVSAPKDGCSPSCSPAPKRNSVTWAGGWGEIGERRAGETPC
jgi:protein-tyrosine-phosphatase